MLNKKVLAVALSMAVSGVAFGDDDDDTHALSITVPQVTLLDVGTNDTTAPEVAFTCSVAGADAGVNLTCDKAASSTDKIAYSITSNVPTAGSVTREITASLSADTLDTTWALGIAATTIAGDTAAGSNAGSAAATPVVLTAGTTSGVVVENITNVASESDPGEITYTLAPRTTGVAMAHTAEIADDDLDLVVTYTLAD